MRGKEKATLADIDEKSNFVALSIVVCEKVNIIASFKYLANRTFDFHFNAFRLHAQYCACVTQKNNYFTYNSNENLV